MNNVFIEEMKNLLATTQQKLVAELAALGSSNRTTTPNFPSYGNSEDENAAEVATYTDALAIERTLRDTLDDVEQAITRIAKGTYGVCRYCGKEIDERRLRARPESSACVSCKTSLQAGRS